MKPFELILDGKSTGVCFKTIDKGILWLFSVCQEIDRDVPNFELRRK